MTALPVPRFDTFYRHDELTRLLLDYADARPDLVRIESIGKSHEGRDIWVAAITNAATGARHRQAGVLGRRQHPRRRARPPAPRAVLPAPARQPATAATPQITQLLDTRAVYLCPRLNPDGAELALADRPRHIRSSTRPLSVRRRAGRRPDGRGHRRRRPRAVHAHAPTRTARGRSTPQDPRLMVRARARRVRRRVLPPDARRHADQNYDGLTIKVNPDLEGLDLNRNFPAAWRQEFEQVGAGAYPTSEPEVRAMVDFIVTHPNIGAAISYHTHSGVILRPMGTQSDDDMIAGGPVVYQALQRARRQAHRLPGDQHLARLQVPPEGGHQRHAGLALRAPRRAVLGGRDLGAEQGSRHHRLQVDRLVPRAPGRRRPEAAEVERRAVRRPGPRRLEAVPCTRSSARSRSAAGTR